MNKTSILIVDDDTSVVSPLELYLTSLGFDVTCIEDSKSAHAFFASNAKHTDVTSTTNNSPGSILVDYSFEGMDICRLVTSLKDRFPSAKIIVSSGYPQAEVLRNLSVELFDSFLPKPFKLMALAEQLGFNSEEGNFQQ